MPPSRLHPSATVALDLIARMDSRRMPISEFELRMHQRGCNVVAMSTALASLERRGWALRQSGMLEVTEAGQVAAASGADCAAQRRIPRATTGRRLPVGFFG